MLIALSREQTSFFAKMGYIEFEDLLSPKELDAILKEVESALTHPLRHFKKDATSLYNMGRDIWRRSDTAKKILCHPRFAGIFADLTFHKCLRIAFDQVFSVELPVLEPQPSNETFLRWLMNEKMEGMGSIQGSVGGVLICLKPGLVDPNCPVLVPSIPGSGIFFDSQFPIEFHQLYKLKGGLYHFIAYAKQTSLYVPRDEDPNSHFLKAFGYAFGDRIREATHPTLLKR